MRTNKLSLRLTFAFVVLALVVIGTSSRVRAQTVRVLHDFNGNGGDGYNSQAGLIFDATGNLYGTTADGGAHGYGVVFELSPHADGVWSEKILYSFDDNGADGLNPQTSLIFDAAGSLYGTTYSGGAYGYGTVYELTAEMGGNWTEKVLHSFNSNGSDGFRPYANLVVDASGNLYGTTSSGGSYGGGSYAGGTVFELSPSADGTWTERILHSFAGTGGFYPYAGLTFDSAGNLYGTTSQGGAFAFGGTVFELSTSTGGGWSEKVLRDFNFWDGWGSTAGVIFDSAGNLYGTTPHLANDGGGTVFELTPEKEGGWTNKVLQNFADNGEDGFYPSALVFDGAENLYGTAFAGGADEAGAVFELSSERRGSEKILLSFDGKDGYGPMGGLILDSSGNLYGTASAGGAYGGGVVFEITP